MLFGGALSPLTSTTVNVGCCVEFELAGEADGCWLPLALAGAGAGDDYDAAGWASLESTFALPLSLMMGWC